MAESNISSTTTSTNWGSYTIAVPSTQLSTGAMHNEGKPAAPPKGLISTTGVQTKAGWIGQVVVDRVIVYETEPFFTGDVDADRDGAMEAVNSYVLNRIRELFAAPAQQAPQS